LRPVRVNRSPSTRVCNTGHKTLSNLRRGACLPFGLHVAVPLSRTMFARALMRFWFLHKVIRPDICFFRLQTNVVRDRCGTPWWVLILKRCRQPEPAKLISTSPPPHGFDSDNFSKELVHSQSTLPDTKCQYVLTHPEVAALWRGSAAAPGHENSPVGSERTNIAELLVFVNSPSG